MTERAIRNAIEDGRISAAVLPDGTIDPDHADRLLAASTVSGPRAPTDLTEARRRKAAASTALLHDEMSELLRMVVPKADAALAAKQSALEVARRIWPIADVGAAAAGKPAAQVADMIENAIIAVLTELSEAIVEAAP